MDETVDEVWPVVPPVCQILTTYLTSWINYSSLDWVVCFCFVFVTLPCPTDCAIRRPNNLKKKATHFLQALDFGRAV